LRRSACESLRGDLRKIRLAVSKNRQPQRKNPKDIAARAL
jgi:Flp pilus assembly CpaE family ATPase